MITAIRNSTQTSTHKPLVTGSNPVAATSKLPSSPTDQGTNQNSHSCPHAIESHKKYSPDTNLISGTTTKGRKHD